jgi:PAS domain S-box-containing protein
MKKTTGRDAHAELKRVKTRLSESEATMKAIRSGNVDAVVVDGPLGNRIFTLQSPEEPYRILAERMNEGAATLTKEGTILFCNARLAEMVGLPAERLLGSSFSSVLCQGDRPAFPELVQQALEKDRRTEMLLLRNDSTMLQVQLSLSPIPLGESEQGVCLIATDLSDRKRGEEARAWLAAVVESSDDAIITKTMEGVITTWNRGAERLFGYSAAEVIGKPMLMLFPPEFMNEESKILARIGHGEPVDNFETIRLRKDGKSVDISVVISLIKDSSSAIIGASDTARDITQQKAAEREIRKLNQELEGRVQQRTAQLQESEKGVRRKLDSILSPEGDLGNLELADILDIPSVQSLVDDVYKLTQIPMFILDLKGKPLISAGWQEICVKFHRANPETCKNCKESDQELTAGVPPGEFKLYKCKNNMWDVVTPITVGEQHVGNVLSGQFFFADEPIDYELFRSQARKYGFEEQEYLAALNRVPRLSRESVETSMRFFIKLAQLLSQLSYSGIKLARSMTETRRVNSQLMASVKELEAFTYSVSHDLRAPLRHLDGFLTLLSKRSYSSLDATAKHYVDSTHEASQRMGTLIDELLQFSRLGHSDMRKVPVNVNELVEQVKRELEPEIRNRTIHWHVEQLPVVIADQGMLRQVIENLLGNSLKFTRQRDVAEIVIGSTFGANGELVIFVRDNGAGFDMQYYNKLFQVFQRLHNEDEFEGTGIGLANVRRMVERQGGRVWAEGAVGAGATFYFSLPSGGNVTGEQNEYVEAHLTD